MTRPPQRRTVLAAAIGAAAAASVTPAFASARPATALAAGMDRTAAADPAGATGAAEAAVDYRSWISVHDWRSGAAEGVRVVAGARPGIAIASPVGTLDYTDPHTGKTATWEKAVWTAPTHDLRHPATEVIASWNAHTPAGTLDPGGAERHVHRRQHDPLWADGRPATARTTSGAPRSTTRPTARAASGPTPSPSTTRRAACV